MIKVGGGAYQTLFGIVRFWLKMVGGNLAYRIFFLTKIVSRIGIFINLKNHDFEGKKKRQQGGGT